MKQEKNFLQTVWRLAIPVALQSMLQSSFSIVDQIMIGQLGSDSVAGVGLAGKFAWIFSVLVSAVGTVAGIMISQYIGQKNSVEIRRSVFVNLGAAVGLAVIFTILSITFPTQIMSIYTQDLSTRSIAVKYLVIMAGTYLPIAGATLLATLFRCAEMASLPLYASIAAAIFNTALNYILIFGKCGVSAMGAEGAAAATLVSQIVNLVLMILLLMKNRGKLQEAFAETETEKREWTPFAWKQYLSMLFPIFICEFAWSLGENVYAAIYGQLGTESCAAMTLINPVQGMMTGALCGISQAAGVLVGKRLGNGEYEQAYAESKKLMKYGLYCSLVLSLLIVFTRGFYVEVYQVKDSVKLLTQQILLAYAIIAPIKVQNMILGGGILRSGGKTKYVMAIDMLGTWVFGVPFGLLAAFVCKFSIPYVYFILSLEECIRFGISLLVFHRRKWMQQL